MELTINVDALDKTTSAVVSADDRTALSELQLLVLGNIEPLVLSFCDSDGGTPAWVTDSSTGLAVGLGNPDVDGAQAYASTSTFGISGTTRTGSISLNSAALRTAVYNARICAPKKFALFTLEIRKTTAAGLVETLGILPVYVATKVLTTNPDNQSVPLPYGIVPRPDITALTGGLATQLDGIDDLNPSLPTGYTILLSYGRVPQTWQIFAGTDATNVNATPAIVRVKNYSASNQRVWVQLY
jgi:hypothetical protein